MKSKTEYTLADILKESSSGSYKPDLDDLWYETESGNRFTNWWY